MTRPPRKIPETASVAIASSGGKLHAPSATRNVGAILEALRSVVPEGGTALEIASGTGEHIARYAAEFTALQWQPTDIAPERLASINAWRDEAQLANQHTALKLDATRGEWSAQWLGQGLILLSNLLHLISQEEAETVLSESALALSSGGVSVIYGPFLRGTTFASEGDRRFHESLRAQDPEIGYKSFQDVQEIQSSAGLVVEPPIEMPASNLFLVARKP